MTINKIIELKIADYIIPDVKNAAGVYSKPGMDLIDFFHFSLTGVELVTGYICFLYICVDMLISLFFATTS